MLLKKAIGFTLLTAVAQLFSDNSPASIPLLARADEMLDIKDKYFYDKDVIGIQKVLALFNYFEFCVLPRPSSTTKCYWDMVRRYYYKLFFNYNSAQEAADFANDPLFGDAKIIRKPK